MGTLASIYFLSMFVAAYEFNKDFARTKKLSLLGIVLRIVCTFTPVINTLFVIIFIISSICFWASDFIVIGDKND